MTAEERDALVAQIEALRMDPDDGKARGAARETFPVGFNDALAEVVALVRGAHMPEVPPPAEVYLVWYGGGVVGVYSHKGAAAKVAKARNDYAEKTYGPRGKRIEARVEPYDVQHVADPRDL